MKILLLALVSFCTFSASFKIKSWKGHKNAALNTYIFWVNGDADRFRPTTNHDSKLERLDKIEVNRIKKLARTCLCNVVILHDQRGTDKWYTKRKDFGAFLYAYSNGRVVSFKKRFKYRTYLSWKEVNQTSINFTSSFYRFVDRIFPDTEKHLVYRGHSFTGNNGRVDMGFDYSQKRSSFGLEKFKKAIAKSDISFKTITFAACSMADIKYALALSELSQYMIATQVNINETGLTGFSYKFLEDVNDELETKEIAHLLGSRLLENFRTVKEKTLFMRETPMAVIDLKKIFNLKPELEAIISELDRGDFHNDQKIAILPSQRYIDLRIEKGASPKLISIIKDKFKVKSFQSDYDLVALLTRLELLDIANDVSDAVTLYDTTSFSQKSGLSLFLTDEKGRK